VCAYNIPNVEVWGYLSNVCDSYGHTRFKFLSSWMLTKLYRCGQDACLNLANLPENNAHVICAVLTSIRITSFACSEYHSCTVRSLYEVPRETEVAVILYVHWSAESQQWLVGKFSSVCAFRHLITIT